MKYIDKGGEYAFFYNWFGDGLLTSTGYKWKSHRKVIVPTFHFKILEEFINVYNKQSDILIKQLRKEVLKDSFEVYQYVTLCTLDIICETAMGISLNIQHNPTDSFYTSVKDMCDVFYQRLFNPLLRIDVLYRWTSIYRKEMKAVKILRTFSNDIIKTRRKEKENKLLQDDKENKFNIKKRISFLDMLLECEIDGKALSHQDIQDEVDTFIFEGHDTTAGGISFALYCLSRNQDVQMTHQDIQDEVDTFIFEGHDTTAGGISFALYCLSRNQDVQEKSYQVVKILGTDKNKHPTHSELMEMKYLEMVITESLRLYPSVPVFSRILTEDVVFEDIIIPKGLDVVVIAYFLHRDPKLYPDPDKFTRKVHLGRMCKKTSLCIPAL